MIVEVRLFAGLHQYVGEAKSGEPIAVDIAAGSSVEALLAQLQIPPAQAFLTLVNGSAETHAAILKDGDRVGIFPPVGGG